MQKEADSIQSTVIARIRREIAQHGLTAEHLFGAGSGSSVGNGSKATAIGRKPASTKKVGAAKRAKYADDQGNAWHGVGKRPQWIHEALGAGRSLTDFLIGSKRTAAAPSTPAKAAPKAAGKVAKRVAGKAASAKKTSPAKKATRAAVGAKPASKTPAKRGGAAATARTAPAKKSAKVKAPEAADASQATS